jgi:hypothetical protein
VARTALDRDRMSATLILDDELSAELDAVGGTPYPFEQATSEPVTSAAVSIATDKRIM